jgi:hypothetical protein
MRRPGLAFNLISLFFFAVSRHIIDADTDKLRVADDFTPTSPELVVIQSQGMRASEHQQATVIWKESCICQTT